jgi:hypothetical protein
MGKSPSFLPMDRLLRHDSKRPALTAVKVRATLAFIAAGGVYPLIVS